MTTYGFDFIDEQGLSRGVDLGAFVTDIDATRHAKLALAASFTAAAIEIWNGDERVARVTRTGSAVAIQTELAPLSRNQSDLQDRAMGGSIGRTFKAIDRSPGRS